MNWISCKQHPHPKIDPEMGTSADVLIWYENRWGIGSYIADPLFDEEEGWFDEFGNKVKPSHYAKVQRPKGVE